MALPRIRLLGVAGALCVLLLWGCGAPAREQGATPAPAPSAQELLAKSGQRLANTSSLHFDLAVEGETFIDPVTNMRLLGAKGDLMRPDRARSTFQLEVTGRAISLAMVSIGGQAWMTNVLTGGWEDAPPELGYRPGILFSAENGIVPIMQRAQGVELLGEERIAGRPVHHVRAAILQSIVRPLTYNTIKGSPVTIDFWIDRETMDLVRARMWEPPRDDRKNPAVWTLDFSHHDKTVAIEPPV